MNFFYPLPEPAARSSSGIRRLPAVRARDAQPPARRPPPRPRGEQERLDLPARQLPAPRPQQRSRSRPATRSPTCRIRDTQARHRVRRRRAGRKIFSPTRRERVPRRLQLRQERAPEHYFVDADVTRQLGLETAPSISPDRPASRRFNFAGGSAANRPTNITDGGRNVDRTIEPELVLDQQQPQPGSWAATP